MQVKPTMSMQTHTHTQKLDGQVVHCAQPSLETWKQDFWHIIIIRQHVKLLTLIGLVRLQVLHANWDSAFSSETEKATTPLFISITVVLVA